MLAYMQVMYYIYIIIKKQKTQDMTTLELQKEAQRLKEMGSPLSIDQLIAFLEKKEAKKAKRDKRIDKGFKRRAAVEKMELKPLWGHGAKYATQAEYHRAMLNQKIELK